MLDLDGGSRSAIEALDAGLGRPRLGTRGRTGCGAGASRPTRPLCVYPTKYMQTPQRLAAGAVRSSALGPATEAELAQAGYQPKEVLRLRPRGKDSGILFFILSGVR